MKPDMIIKKGKKSSVIIDAKYKHNITDEDLNQIWIYSLVHLLPVSILVYPMFGITQNETRTLVGQGVDALIRSIEPSVVILLKGQEFANLQINCGGYTGNTHFDLSKMSQFQKLLCLHQVLFPSFSPPKNS